MSIPTASPILVLLLFGTVTGAANEPPIAFKISAPRDGDQVAFSTQDNITVFAVHSQRGIGRATIERNGDQWPDSMKLHMHLRGLESLKISNGQVTLAASVLSHSNHARLLHVWKDGKEGPRLDSRSPFWTNITTVDRTGKPAAERIPLKAGYFVVPIPPALVADNPRSLSVAWIDFYR